MLCCCARRVSGSAGRGQDREIQAQHVEVIGLVDDPETYPISKNSTPTNFCVVLPI